MHFSRHLRIRPVTELLPNASTYLVAFVPGYAYKKDTTTGAKFVRQREFLQQLGFRTTFIETDELGSVEKDAGIVAGAVRQFDAAFSQLTIPLILIRSKVVF